MTRTRLRIRPWAALSAMLALLLAPLSPLLVPVSAQATINTTTLSAALAGGSSTRTDTVSLTSGSTVAVGHILYVDREAIRVAATTPTATIFTVQRGVEGTTRAAHAVGAVVFTGPPSFFSASTAQQEVAGACVAGAEIATPKIYLQTGNSYACGSGTWKLLRRGGLADAPLFGVGATYTASGAIAHEPGIVTIGVAGVGAMTLAAPSAAINGTIMTIVSSTANAHTVTYTPGYCGGTTTHDVATFAAVVGSSFTIMAVNGVWCAIALQGVTIT